MIGRFSIVFPPLIAFALFLPATLYSLSAHQHAGQVPAWAKTAVWYQIFPERFRNGDRSNDPTRADLIGSWPHEFPDDWQVSRWTGDWYELQPWEQDDHGFYFHAQHRRYGGDLQGIIDKLDYLRNLGITAIYLNPLFESPSLHKYDAAAYHHIDDNFGPDPVGDRKLWNDENPSDPATWQWSSADRLFLRLIAGAHSRGIRIIIDGVFNHVGLNFWAFRDLAKNQKASAYRDWFTVHRWDDPATPENEFEYEGWAGVKELPEIREDEDGLIEPFAQHVSHVVKRWMDPNGDGDPSDGIDGWRLDVAEKVGFPFWRKFRKWVKEINPDAYLVGEVWWEDWARDKMFNAALWLQGDTFDAVMNYRWAREAFLFFAANKSRITAGELTRRIDGLLSDYPADVNNVLMNLYSSHDTDRFASRIKNADLPFDHQAGLADNRAYDCRKPDAEDRKTQKLMILFQMTCVGAPMIYYGSEAGMWGADDPDCRKPMVWEGLTFAPERHHPFRKTRPVDENLFDRDIFEWYRRAIAYRRGRPALQAGEIVFLKTNDEQSAVAYSRQGETDAVIVVLNNAEELREVFVEVPAELKAKRWTSGIGNAEFRFDDGLRVTLGGKSGLAIHSEW